MHCVSEELRLKLTDRIFELTESKVRELGYELYDVEYQKEYDTYYDKEYARVAKLMKFDYCQDDGVAASPEDTNT